MAAVGCRKSAIFDRGSNLWGLRLIKMKKKYDEKRVDDNVKLELATLCV